MRNPRRIVPGAAPGTLRIDENAPPPRLRVTAYDDRGAFFDQEISRVEELVALREKYATVWIDVIGLGDAALLQALAAELGLHKLTLEDVVNLGQRPKAEVYPDYIYVVARAAPDRPGEHFEQISLVLGEGWVLTVQEHPQNPFDPVRRRLAEKESPIRSRGADYLLYALLDSILDPYFPLLDVVRDRLQGLEDESLERPEQATLGHIRSLRTDLLELRRVVAPHREAVHTLLRGELPRIGDQARLYLADTYDHVVQILELVEAYRELGSDLMNVYLTSVSNKMNEVMKVLTIIATIFIPLSFVAGIYGMNFDTGSPWNMPELSWRFGYPAVLGGMAAALIGLVLYFRRKGWL
ncbi:hypothetical protein ABI59_15375 [Acidobacteria bacterium Mor1]|nr:hypothetical protein ABI59_15375 [Acidobacteria bacterium Mor1]